MSPEEYCQQKTGGNISSFYYSFLFLTPTKRRAITALYAYCREVDDIVDECSDLEVAHTKLNWWRSEIDRTYDQKATHPITKALMPAIQGFEMPKQYFIDILDGMEMDLSVHRYQSFKDLQEYCYRAASVVGLLSVHIFGFKNPQTLEFAKNLGTCLQLINIIRDVGEDAQRNRIYLPIEDLQQFNVTADDILNRNNGPQLNALLNFQAERAKHYYELAMNQLADDDRQQQLAGLIMANIYLTILHEIDRDGFRVLQHKIALPTIRKLWIAWKTARSERRRHKKWSRQWQSQS